MDESELDSGIDLDIAAAPTAESWEIQILSALHVPILPRPPYVTGHSYALITFAYRGEKYGGVTWSDANEGYYRSALLTAVLAAYVRTGEQVRIDVIAQKEFYGWRAFGKPLTTFRISGTPR